MMRPSLTTRLRRLEARALATAREHPPRLVVVYEADPLPADCREHDQVIRVVYEDAKPRLSKHGSAPPPCGHRKNVEAHNAEGRNTSASVLAKTMQATAPPPLRSVG